MFTASVAESTAGDLADAEAYVGMINRLSNLIASANIKTLTEWQ